MSAPTKTFRDHKDGCIKVVIKPGMSKGGETLAETFPEPRVEMEAGEEISQSPDPERDRKSSSSRTHAPGV